MFDKSPAEKALGLTESAIQRVDPMDLIGLSIGAIVALSVIAFAIFIYKSLRKTNNTNGKDFRDLRQAIERDHEIIHERINRTNERYDKMSETLNKVARDVSYLKGKFENN